MAYIYLLKIRDLVEIMLQGFGIIVE